MFRERFQDRIVKIRGYLLVAHAVQRVGEQLHVVVELARLRIAQDPPPQLRALRGRVHAVDLTVDQLVDAIVAHDEWIPFRTIRSRRIERAENNRDLTVSSRISRISLISR